jgi:hypothetical protein
MSARPRRCPNVVNNPLIVGTIWRAPWTIKPENAGQEQNDAEQERFRAKPNNLCCRHDFGQFVVAHPGRLRVRAPLQTAIDRAAPAEAS